jgi:hypothetical protein
MFWQVFSLDIWLDKSKSVDTVTVAKLEVVLVVLGTSKHFSKKIIFYCLNLKKFPQNFKNDSWYTCVIYYVEILSNPVMLL